jgi:hypothetical protein
VERTLKANDSGSVELAAKRLGDPDTKTTVLHYIRPSEVVNPATAELLGRALLERATEGTL